MLSKTKAPLLWCTATAVLLAVTALCWPGPGWLQTDLFALLPSATDSHWQKRADHSLTQSYESKLLLRVSAKSGAASQQFLQQITAELTGAGFLAPQQQDLEQERWRALSQVLYPYRRGLITAQQSAALRDDAEGFLRQYRQYLHSPLGASSLNTLPGDPAGLFREFIEHAAPGMATGGNDGEVVALSLRAERLGLQRLEALYSMYLDWKSRASGQGLLFQASGPPLYSAFGVHSASREISTIGIASLCLLSLLLVLCLRSFRALLLTLLCVASGLTCGLLTTIVMLQQVHLLTLVFGATLIGIAADYALHYLAHSLSPHWRRERALATVYRSLYLGAFSSAIAFAALALLPFPGIRQIGVFMAAGLLGSFATVCLLFPALYPGLTSPGRLPAFCRFTPGRQRRWPVLAALLLLLPGLALLTPRDEIRDFYAAPPQLEADENAITAAAGAARDSRYFLITAASPEELLVTEELLLAQAQQRPGDARLSAISQLIPAAQTQRNNAELLARLAAGGALSAHLEGLGIDAEQGREMTQAYRQTDFNPVTLNALSGLSLPTGTGRFLGCRADSCASYVAISGAATPRQLAQLASDVPGADLVDRVAEVNRLLASYRVWVVALLLVGGLAAGAVLTAAAGWRSALRMIFVPVTACLASFAALGYLHGQFSVVNLLALLLIIGVSLDYAVFRSLTPVTEQAATTLAITLSACTSILAFGMLGFSSTPVISAFGQTIAIGLVAAYGLSWLVPPGGEASE